MLTEPTRYEDPFRDEDDLEARCLDCGAPGTALCSPCEAFRAAQDDATGEDRWTPEEFGFEPDPVQAQEERDAVSLRQEGSWE